MADQSEQINSSMVESRTDPLNNELVEWVIEPDLIPQNPNEEVEMFLNLDGLHARLLPEEAGREDRKLTSLDTEKSEEFTLSLADSNEEAAQAQCESQDVRSEPSPKNYHCRRCNELFSSMQELLEHMAGPLFECKKKFVCSKCGGIYINQWAFGIHFKKNCSTIPSPFKKNLHCPRCKKEFSGKYALKRHIQRNTCSNPMTCRHCGYIAKNNASKKAHQRYCGKHITTKGFKTCSERSNKTDVDSQKPFETSAGSLCGYQPHHLTCPYCNKRFARRYRLLGHMQINRCQEKFACIKCGFITKTKANLGMHQKTCTGIQYSIERKCPKCKRVFSTRGNLKKHIFTNRCKPIDNSNSTSNKCSYCSKNFSSRQNLLEHIRKKRCKQDKQQQMDEKKKDDKKCPHCNKLFSSRYAMMSHMRKKLCNVGQSCPKCGTTFKTYIGVNVHMRTCTGTPLKCPKCGRTFANRENLKNHISGTSMTCERCCKRFYNPQLLATHKKNCKGNAGKTINQCPHCKKAFSRETVLQKHIKRRICLDVKTFPCIKCNRVFTTRRSLAAHVTACPRKVFQCHTCQLLLPNEQRLIQHMRGCRCCEKCGRNFPNQVRFAIHKRSCGKPILNCIKCGKLFSNSFGLRTHVTFGKCKIDCKLCGKELHASAQTAHYLVCDKRNVGIPVKCPYCTRGFENEWNLTKHLQSNRCLKNHSMKNCLYCEEMLPYVCKICNKSFTCQFLRDRHFRLNNANAPSRARNEDIRCIPARVLYLCARCNVVSVDPLEISEHMKLSHGIGNNGFPPNDQDDLGKREINGLAPLNACCRCRGRFFSRSFAKFHLVMCQPNLGLDGLQ